MSAGGLAYYSREGDIAVVTLDNPPANALSDELVDQLQAALERTSESDARALVLCTANPRFFGAGADISLLARADRAGFVRYLDRLRRAIATLRALSIPTVAAIDGLALGGGFELTLNCDLRWMGPSARVGLPEIALGLLPGATGTQRLPAVIGVERAKELMLSGRQVGRDEAVTLGIAFAAEESARASALEWAGDHLAGSNEAAAAILRCVDAFASDPEGGLEVERLEVHRLFDTPYARARIEEFVQRRPGSKDRP